MVVVNSIIAFLLTFSPIAISLTMRKPEDKKEQINAIFLEATNRIARFFKKTALFIIGSILKNCVTTSYIW